MHFIGSSATLTLSQMILNVAGLAVYVNPKPEF